MTDPTTALAAALHREFWADWIEHAPSDGGTLTTHKCGDLEVGATQRILAALSGWTLVSDAEVERLRRIEAAARALVGQTTFSDDKAHVYPDVDPDGFANNPRAWHRLRAALTPESSNAK